MKMEPTGRENSNTTNRAVLLATKALLIQPLLVPILLEDLLSGAIIIT